MAGSNSTYNSDFICNGGTIVFTPADGLYPDSEPFMINVNDIHYIEQDGNVITFILYNGNRITLDNSNVAPVLVSDYSTGSMHGEPMTDVPNLLTIDSNGELSTLNVWDCGEYE